MKIFALLLIFVSIIFDSVAQDVPDYQMDAKFFQYGKWKLKDGDNVQLSSGDSLKLGKLKWYTYKGFNVVFSTVIFEGKNEQLDIRGWIDEEKIKIPVGFNRLPVRVLLSLDDEIPTIDDSFLTKSGYKICKGMDVLLGAGTMPNGDFKYIYDAPLNWATFGSSRANLPALWSGYKFRVKKIKTIGTQRRGYKTTVVLGGGNIINYETDIDNAIAVGEITIPNELKINPKETQVIMQQKLSVADEIKKLKQLLDDKILNQEEYDLQKKKILSL